MFTIFIEHNMSDVKPICSDKLLFTRFHILTTTMEPIVLPEDGTFVPKHVVATSLIYICV
jgi:hypothetical protein